ncbi:IgGFc-binding protein-like isoform X1 [Portunus trituberculatus]|uniref:IgGFc-binding protein-like isoform X1 n=1 Tax=Portunus trituberculatus TaxID=210409 RepID=UPI001E1D0ED3|nr:IgGFc-binding protein-like isoform X1 [Portunus trituberculatus]
MTNSVPASQHRLTTLSLLVLSLCTHATANTTTTALEATTTTITTTTTTTAATSWTHESCYFGNSTLEHGDTALELPECCMKLLCCSGDIVKSNRWSEPASRSHDLCHDDHHDHIWDHETHDHLDFHNGLYGKCCMIGDRMYPSGHILTTFCLRMVCHDGHWDFAWSIDPTCGYCWIHDYPHFSTFDGYHYNWYGLCNYTLAQTNDSTDPSDPHTAVYITFRKCFRRRRAVGMPTCLSTVTFRENPYTIIQIDPLNATWMTVNGEPVAMPEPHDLNHVSTSHGLHPVLALNIHGCITLIGASGFVVMQCLHRVDVWVSSTLAGAVDGLCGPFNTDLRLWERSYERYNTSLFPLMWLADDEDRLKCYNNDPDINNAAKCRKSPTNEIVRRCEANTRGNPYLNETCQYDLCKLGERPRLARGRFTRWLRVVRLNAYFTEKIANATGYMY